MGKGGKTIIERFLAPPIPGLYVAFVSGDSLSQPLLEIR
jgi:hypothetical protein